MTAPGASWRVPAASALILGFVVGIPYFSLPFFYDYFAHPVETGGFGWSRGAIVLGLPIGTLVPLLLAPALTRRVPLRPGIVAGSMICAVAIAGFGLISGSLCAYLALWILYMIGWTIAGPLAHQILLAGVLNWNRGGGLALSSFGISVFGALSVACLARPLTSTFGFRSALVAIGCTMLLAVPIAWSALPGTQPPLRSKGPDDIPEVSRSPVFWILLAGSTLTAAGIAGVSQHLKFILRERGDFTQQQLDEVFSWTLTCMLTGSAIGRFAFAWGADRLSRRRLISAAFLLMLAAMVLLYVIHGPRVPYVFGALFGLGMSTDSLLVALVAADHFGPAAMPRAMSRLVPVNSVGQTWFPFVVALFWEHFGNYRVALLLMFACILTGRFLLTRLPDRP